MKNRLMPGREKKGFTQSKATPSFTPSRKARKEGRLFFAKGESILLNFWNRKDSEIEIKILAVLGVLAPLREKMLKCFDGIGVFASLRETIFLFFL